MVQIADALIEEAAARVDTHIGAGLSVSTPIALIDDLTGSGALGTRRCKQGGKG